MIYREEDDNTHLDEREGTFYFHSPQREGGMSPRDTPLNSANIESAKVGGLPFPLEREKSE